jgi:hypothetical protein
MKNLLTPCALFLLICILFGCEQKDCCVLNEGEGSGLAGTWLLYEHGYSPGFGEVTEPVSPSPAQTLTFKSNGRMTSSLEGLSDYKFYFIRDAPVAEQRIVAFYKHYPGESPDPSTFDPSYHFSFEGENGENLKLYFRYCFEGCHLGLSRIE